jgi:AcrR family transcriptional regulator
MQEALARKRLTRVESRAQTRERLLEAAFTVFARDGIEAASIEEIAEAAGYSRGAFYSNFDSKDDLLLALLDRKMEEAKENIAAILGDNLRQDQIIERIREYYVDLASDSQHCTFALAVQLHSLQNPEIRPRVAEWLKRDRELVIEQAQDVYAAIGKEPPYSAEIVALGLISISQGLGLTQAIDPTQVPPDLLALALETLFNRVAGLDEIKATQPC